MRKIYSYFFVFLVIGDIYRITLLRITFILEKIPFKPRKAVPIRDGFSAKVCVIIQLFLLLIFRDIYRIIFTGETDERGLDLKSIEEQFAPDFFHLELRDETRIGEDVWARAQEDSLRGLFLRELRTKFDDASSDDERAKISLAARFGLAALDGCDL